MKNVLNAVSAILIILFLGWQFCGDCCEKKCDKSGVTKCKSYETKKECPHANKENLIVTEEEVTDEGEDEVPLDEDLGKEEGEEDEN